MYQYNIKHFDVMNKNQIIHIILTAHYNSINIAAKKVKSKYRWIPLESEDLLNVFINKIPEIAKEYNPNLNTKFSTYIINNAFYTMANYARTFSSRRFDVLNRRIRIVGSQLRERIQKDYSYRVEGILSTNYNRIDISGFLDLEKQILNEYFSKKMSVRSISIKHNFSHGKTLRLINIIRRKIKTNHKISFINS